MEKNQNCMVSKHIKAEIEQKLGREIRYPLDCEALAIDIFKQCGETISASTLKRFFGFVPNTEPRMYTLDVLSHYLGYKNWDEYLDSLTNKSESSEFVNIEELTIHTLTIGDRYEFCYEPMRKVTIEYLGNMQCKVLESINAKLKENDVITISTITRDYPLLISSVIRNGVSIGALTVGKVSGITAIQKVQ